MTGPGRPSVYQIRVQGHLGAQWKKWFQDASIVLQENGETLIACPVVDQAALHGLLKKVRDLGMVLLSVQRLDPGQGEAPEEDRD